jgi:hypothetical protein
MKHLLTLLLIATAALAGEPPLAFPDLQHFDPLWERSIFTTRDLPSPDVPIGPVFTDSLSLAGIYEVDGQVVAVIVDRNTSLINEARIGSENEAGIKIRKVQQGASMDKSRIQLQKGDQAGWVGFADAVPTETVAPAIVGQQQQAQQKLARPVSAQSLVSPLLPALNQAPAMPPPTTTVSAPSSTAEALGDVPLPPP